MFRTYLSIAVLVLAGTAEAQTIQLSADRTQVGVGDVFSVTVAMTVDDGADTAEPDLNLPQDFDLMGTRSSTSTSISIVNGSMSQTRTVNYVSTIRANREGSFTIGPAEVRAGNKTIRSQSIRVDVRKGVSKPRASAAPTQESVTADQLREIEQNLFIRAVPDRKSVYVGEQILVSYDLYSRYRIQNPRFGVVPSYTGFWAEKVFEASRLEQRPETVNGKSYNKSLLKQVALFPTVPGKQKLEQMEFICDVPVRSRRRSVFDVDDFFSWDPFRSRQVTVRASDLELEARSLPSGAPRSFSGGVGEFEVGAKAATSQVTQGDPVTVTVVVRGDGNIQGVSEPLRPSSNDFKFYDPKTSVDAQVAGTILTGAKTFEYIVIPATSGRVTLPAFELAYFDPKADQYRTVRTEPILFEVVPGEKLQQVTLSTAPVGSAVEIVGEDIRYIKADATSLETHAGYLHQSGLFWSFHVLPIIGLLAGWQWRRRQLLLEGDVALARKRRSRGEARKRLTGARELLDVEGASFHAEVHRSVATFLGDRLNLETTELTSAQAKSILGERGVSPDTVTEVVALIEACDFARFAPSAGGSADRKALVDRAERLIDTLEKAT